MAGELGDLVGEEGEGEGEEAPLGGDLRGVEDGGERRGGGDGNGHALAVVLTLTRASLDSMAGVGLLLLPDRETPRFLSPVLPVPQL